MPSRHWIGVAFFAAFVTPSTSALAVETVHLPSIRDNTLYESQTGGLSNGAGMHMFAGMNGLEEIRRALVLFPVPDSVPPGSTVESVQLALHMSRTMPGTRDIRFHRVLRSWGEGGSIGEMGEGGGGAATSGDATWKHTFFDTEFWVNDGGDFVATSSHVQAVSDTGFYVFGPSAGLAADVQHWVDNPSENFGWMLRGVESGFSTAKRFDTKDHTVTTVRPLLQVRFTPPSVTVGDPARGANVSLRAPVPNPLGERSRIAFVLPREGPVRLTVHDAAGRGVATLAEGRRAAGEHRLEWDGRGSAGGRLGAGVYWLRLEVLGTIVARRFVVLP